MAQAKESHPSVPQVKAETRSGSGSSSQTPARARDERVPRKRFKNNRTLEHRTTLAAGGDAPGAAAGARVRALCCRSVLPVLLGAPAAVALAAVQRRSLVPGGTLVATARARAIDTVDSKSTCSLQYHRRRRAQAAAWLAAPARRAPRSLLYMYRGTRTSGTAVL